MVRTAGIVLVGGSSSRMGQPKALLALDGEPLVARTARVVEAALGAPVLVVRQAGQELPVLPPFVEIVEDALPGRGPLEGLAAGLRALRGRADTAYVSAVDLPFLSSAFARAVVNALGPGDDAAVPVVAGESYPLSAAYRLRALTAVEMRLDRGELRMRSLLDDLRVRWLDEAALGDVDPGLTSLTGVNTPEDWAAALRGTPSTAPEHPS